MLEIRPFKGLLYNPKKIQDMADVTAPPYDVISPEMQEALYARSPYNIVRVELNRTPGEEKYADAAKAFQDWRREEVLTLDERPAFYRYVQDYEVPGAGGERKRRIGFFALVRLAPFEEEVVLPHERTLPKAKADRLELMKKTSANISQVFTFYGDREGKVDAALKAAAPASPDFTLTDEAGVVHELSRITDEKALAAASELMKDKQIFIADGHHRYETALNYRAWRREQDGGAPGEKIYDFFEIYLTNMDHEGLSVLPIHRVAHSIENFDEDAFLKKLAERFDLSEVRGDDDRGALVETLARNADRTSFGVALRDRPFLLARLKEDFDAAAALEGRVSPVARSLDVARLHALVLEDVMGIDQEAILKQTNVRFDANRDRALDSLQKDAQAVFILNPTKVEQVREVARARELMPQKSTFFYPKLLTGLVINVVDP